MVFFCSGTFSAADMMRILRDEDSGICMTGGFLSTGSQVDSIHSFTHSFIDSRVVTCTEIDTKGRQEIAFRE